MVGFNIFCRYEKKITGTFPFNQFFICYSLHFINMSSSHLHEVMHHCMHYYTNKLSFEIIFLVPTAVILLQYIAAQSYNYDFLIRQPCNDTINYRVKGIMSSRKWNFRRKLPVQLVQLSDYYSPDTITIIVIFFFFCQ